MTQAKIGTEPAAGVVALLLHWLRRRLKPEASQWLEGEIAHQGDAPDERRFGIALGLAGRRIGRDDLSLSAADLAAAQELRRNWRPDIWRTDEAAHGAHPGNLDRR